MKVVFYYYCIFVGFLKVDVLLLVGIFYDLLLINRIFLKFGKLKEPNSFCDNISIELLNFYFFPILDPKLLPYFGLKIYIFCINLNPINTLEIQYLSKLHIPAKILLIYNIVLLLVKLFYLNLVLK